MSRHTLTRIHLVIWILVSSLASVGSLTATPNPVQAEETQAAKQATKPNAVEDTPDVLVGSGVSDYTLAAPKVFWHTHTCDPRPPALASAPASAASADIAPDFESLSRVAVQGSGTRTLYSASATGYCGTLAHTSGSNLIADNDYLYWTTDQGLVRLSTSANPGDAPQIFDGSIIRNSTLAQDDTDVYVLSVESNHAGHVFKVRKSDGQHTLVTNAGLDPFALSVSHSFSIVNGAGDYVYWIDGGVLRRFNLNTSLLENVASGIVAYYAEGGRVSCVQLICAFTDTIFMSTGQTVLSTSNHKLGTVNTLYDTHDSHDRVYSLTTDANHLFFLQEHCVATNAFCSYVDFVYRRGRGTGGNNDVLYTSPSSISGVASNLTTANGYLMWQDAGRILRLPNDASALPQTNLRITGFEITQGIQKSDNSVILVQGKRTFARLFVQSDGPAVAGVTASLCRRGGPFPECVSPANSVGTNLTVWPSPQRSNLNDSFLFELPWRWVQNGSLSLAAELNPYHVPPQASYANNSLNVGPFNLATSPRLQVQFIAWGYVLNNQTYYPRFVQDIVQTYSWIRRAYPLSSAPGFSTDATPGFRPNLWFASDDSLGARVDQSHKDCQGMTDKSLCASAFTNQQMVSMRTENGLPDSLFFYGMISDAAGPFPRGQACCGPNVSTGPAGSGTWGWDTDGSYADWYAAHEIGHTLGRGHPASGNTTAHSCRTYDAGSGTDAGFPWSYAQIGQDDNTEGFDAGDASLHINQAVYPGTSWHDVMSYCNNQWLSDYTYKAMYDYMIAHPTQTAQDAAPARVQSPRVSGDFLAVYGEIVSGTNTASLNRVRHLSSIAEIPDLTPGAYAIRLMDASNNPLAEYAFTPQGSDDAPNQLHFTQVVTYAAGTRQVRIVRRADNQVLTTADISANPPTLSAVALQGAPNPVTGTVTLGWTASDADGDALSFDIYYSKDGGNTLQPLRMNVSDTSTQIDTARLGGGPAILRVIANDGANTAQADTASFTVAAKPPQPHIDTPASGLHIHYGQLVNFSGEAEDFQDGGVADAGLVWTTQHGTLGTGALVSSQDLPVGTNTITLTAQNSLGLSASTTITVVVDDDLNLLDATLTAGPTQFAWDFAQGATAPQTSTLNISNAGSGSLDWTASSNVPWLTLSATSGAAPASITLTANPTGIADGSTQAGLVTLTAPPTGSQPTQTLSIPVNMAVGLRVNDPNGVRSQRVFLPLIQR